MHFKVIRLVKLKVAPFTYYKVGKVKIALIGKVLYKTTQF